MLIIDGIEITRALIVDEPWISKFLAGEKSLEMRSSRTRIRGWIGLIRKGSGEIVGIAELTDSGDKPLSLQELKNLKDKHCIDYEQNPELVKWRIPWTLSNVRQIKPIPYTHPQGAVIWVKL